jgi:dTMP kinase
MDMTTGKLISIEGSEGAGKSTVQAFVQQYLQQTQIKVVLTREPGGTAFAEEIRNLLLHTKDHEPLEKETELLLMFAARAQHIKHGIVPALDAGAWVVSDRYIDASYAYQGGGRGISQKYLAFLDQWIVAGLYPHLTLLLDIPVEMGFARTALRGTYKDRIEQEKIVFFEQVRAAYLQRASEDPERIKIIDASQSLLEVQAQIKHVLDQFCLREKI